MLIYLSNRKIENLCTEFSIKKSVIESIMPDKVHAKLDVKLGIANGSIESQHTFLDANQTRKVLKKLKSENSLIELISGGTHIKPLNYYICDGWLTYDGRIDGYLSKTLSNEILDRYRGDREFFDDDKLKFKVKISHDKYQFVNISCTADSIHVFGGRNLSAYHGDVFKNNEQVRHPHSGDPGILNRALPIRLIYWCLTANEALGQITGSPLMISC